MGAQPPTLDLESLYFSWVCFSHPDASFCIKMLRHFYKMERYSVGGMTFPSLTRVLCKAWQLLYYFEEAPSNPYYEYRQPRVHDLHLFYAPNSYLESYLSKALWQISCGDTARKFKLHCISMEVMQFIKIRVTLEVNWKVRLLMNLSSNADSR